MSLAPRPLHTAKILIVDDQEDSLLILTELLAEDYQILAARSGKEALVFCEAELPDLIVLDNFMEDIDGLDICRELKSVTELEDIPVIFVTGSREADLENACWEAGAIDFVTKPINANSLKNRVKAHISLKLQSDFIRGLAFIDGLTGVYNRNYLKDYLVSQIRYTKRNKSFMTLVLFDIDYFKAYNDSLGHLKGDECLKLVSATLKSGIRRPLDMIARFGGEEFVVVLPDTDQQDAEAVVLRLVEAISSLNVHHPGSPYGRVTISAGVAVLCGDSGQVDLGEVDLLKRADLALYNAKKTGRNRSVFWSK